jgi:hypothetical protein
VAAVVVVMSIHRLSSGSGYQYLLRHTASGDIQRLAGTPLTSYYTASGYPPGRWAGSGLAGGGAVTTKQHTARSVDRSTPAASSASDPAPLASGSAVTEEQMGRLYGRGLDPLTGERLGARYVVHRTVEQRITARTGQLPDDLPAADREAAVADIAAEERRRRTPSAVAGFDLTFTMPKSGSVLWALAGPELQARIAAAHRATVADVIGVLERDALFTRTGHGGAAQIATQGAIAACFDHWDTRAGDLRQVPASGCYSIVMRVRAPEPSDICALCRQWPRWPCRRTAHLLAIQLPGHLLSTIGIVV